MGVGLRRTGELQVKEQGHLEQCEGDSSLVLIYPLAVLWVPLKQQK